MGASVANPEPNEGLKQEHAPLADSAQSLIGERGPITRSHLREIRNTILAGLRYGASIQAIANVLEFHDGVTKAMPNMIAGMAINADLPIKDRIAAAKTWAVFVGFKMEQEKRDKEFQVKTILDAFDKWLLIDGAGSASTNGESTNGHTAG